MDFSFKPKITQELILSHYTEEQIMEYYLHIPVKKGLFRSPLRRDRNPTCSFFRNQKGNLIFKDFATGQYLNCFAVVQTLFNCSYFEALKIVANDLGIVKMSERPKNKGKINYNPVRIEEKEQTIIQVEIQPFLEWELKWWNRYGITEDILKEYDVYSCKHVFLNGSLLAKSQQNCPIYGYYGKKYQGIELWRCYFPKRRDTYRFISNWPGKKIQGYNQLPKKGKLVVITKSLKDVMCLRGLGIHACAPCSENLFVSDAILSDLKDRFENIVVFYDNDRAGLYNMAKIRHNHPELEYVWIPKKYGCKDISDFYAENKRNKTLNLVKEFILWLKEHRKN